MEHRDHARAASTANAVAGLWLVASPYFFSYATSVNPFWNNILIGGLIGVIALIRAYMPMRIEWLSWVNLALGLWVTLSAFVLPYPNLNSAWSNIIVGLLIAFLASRSAMETHMVKQAHRS